MSKITVYLTKANSGVAPYQLTRGVVLKNRGVVLKNRGVVLKKRCWNAVPIPNKKEDCTKYFEHKVSIRLQEFPHWIFLLHCRLLTRSAKLSVATTSVRS